MATNNFAIQLPSTIQDPKGYFKKAFMERVLNNYPELTINGIDEPTYSNPKRNRGVQHATANDLITVGTAEKHDIDWVNTKPYNHIVSEVPIYDLATQYAKAVSKLDAYAKAKRQKSSSKYYGGCSCSACCGCNNAVEVFDNFIKIGYDIIQRVITPRVICTYSYTQIQVVKRVIIAVSNLY
jgi:hypothetical protein